MGTIVDTSKVALLEGFPIVVGAPSIHEPSRLHTHGKENKSSLLEIHYHRNSSTW